MKARTRLASLSAPVVSAAAAAALLGAAAGAAGVEPGAGLVVERVAEGSAAQRAGLKPGDVIVAWTRAAAPPANPAPDAGPLSSPFELEDLRIEQAPRGEVTLVARRGGRSLLLRMPPGHWWLETRPQLPGDVLEAYGRSRAAGAAPAWRAAAHELEARAEPARAAWLLFRLALAQMERDQLDAAAESFAAAAHALEPASPVWVAHVKSWEAWSLEKRNQRIERALALRNEALRLREQADPESLAVAHTLTVLGILARDLGDLAAAEAHQRRALAIRERAAPRSLGFSHNLNNLGNVLYARGDLATAEHYLRRALDLRRELAPDGTEVAQSLNNLGELAWSRGDVDAARAYFEEALQLQRRLEPRSLAAAAMLMNLGELAFDSGRAAEARRLFESALAIEQKLSPDGLEVAGSLVNLARAALAEGDRAAARRHLERALSIRERLAPQSLGLAETVERLGDLELQVGALGAAEGRYRRALAIRERLAPGSALEAESLHGLAVLHRRAGRRDTALEAALRGLAALEKQSGRLGGSTDARSRFLARHAAYYRDAIDLLRLAGRSAEAFHVLERSRARGLLTLLAERDLAFAEVPPALARERRETDAEYDRLLGRLAELTGRGDEAEREPLRAQLDRVRLKQEELRARVRAASPRLAALQYPEPLDLEATRRALDRGTLLLSYSLGPESGLLFAVGPGADELGVFDLEAGAEALRAEVQAFREQLLRGRYGAGDARLRVLARALGAQLLLPVADRIARAERLLIVADRALHALPFAGLADPSAEPAFRYLVEGRPVHVAASATVFARLKKRRRAAGSDDSPPALAAFGDPAYPGPAAGAGDVREPVLRSLLGQGLYLRPLPGSRAEVESLRALFPESARVFLGAEATEEQARALGPEARIVHFACHGVPDNRFPLDSALALSIPARVEEGRANGLLQAWEIFEHVRLDADLVTLSACETGLGVEQAGEGMLGLTRAFQFAGARSVLASLWNVSDASTAPLMERFYRALKAGRPKDEALRQAQLEALRDAGRAHPVHWAAFQLFGDWR